MNHTILIRKQLSAEINKPAESKCLLSTYRVPGTETITVNGKHKILELLGLSLIEWKGE